MSQPASSLPPLLQPARADPAAIDDVAHLALLVGRLLLLNGADTASVQQAMLRFSEAFGYEAHVLVTYEALLLTVVSGAQFRTKIGHPVPAMGVSMRIVTAVNGLVEQVERGGWSLAQARDALDGIGLQPPHYPRWLVVAALGLTAASLSRLFGGDWPTFGVALLAGMAGTWLRLECGRRKLNPVFIPFAAALLSGVIGAAGVLLGASGTAALCLVTPGMIIVPGVPLINGVQDMIENHMTVGLSRLGAAGLVTMAIALGLFLATVATGVTIPVNAPAALVPVAEDAVFSALAALGFTCLFDVPPRLAWACIVCGVASHTTRTLCTHLGIDIVSGTLIGALLVGFIAQGFARAFDAPAVAFAFPGVVAMVPGVYAFRAAIGSLQIVSAGSAASPALIAETLSLGIAGLLMVTMIAIGVVAPLILFVRGPARPGGSR